jgi:hypothetical protein
MIIRWRRHRWWSSVQTNKNSVRLTYAYSYYYDVLYTTDELCRSEVEAGASKETVMKKRFEKPFAAPNSRRFWQSA